LGFTQGREKEAKIRLLPCTTKYVVREGLGKKHPYGVQAVLRNIIFALSFISTRFCELKIARDQYFEKAGCSLLLGVIPKQD